MDGRGVVFAGIVFRLVVFVEQMTHRKGDCAACGERRKF